MMLFRDNRDYVTSYFITSKYVTLCVTYDAKKIKMTYPDSGYKMRLSELKNSHFSPMGFLHGSDPGLEPRITCFGFFIFSVLSDYYGAKTKSDKNEPSISQAASCGICI